MPERFVQFDIADWQGSWGELECALDKFAENNAVTLTSIVIAGPRGDEPSEQESQ